MYLGCVALVQSAAYAGAVVIDGNRLELPTPLCSPEAIQHWTVKLAPAMHVSTLKLIHTETSLPGSNKALEEGGSTWIHPQLHMQGLELRSSCSSLCLGICSPLCKSGCWCQSRGNAPVYY